MLIGKWTSCILLYTIKTYSWLSVYAQICLSSTLQNEIQLVHICGFQYPVKRIFIYVLLCAFCKMDDSAHDYIWTRDRPSKIVLGGCEQMTGYGEELISANYTRNDGCDNRFCQNYIQVYTLSLDRIHRWFVWSLIYHVSMSASMKKLHPST